MKTNKIIKQIIITQEDIVHLVIDELINLERIEESDYQENLYESVTFDFIQSHCNKDIEQVLKNFKTGIDDIELDEFEFWFGFNTDSFLEQLNKKFR